MGFVGQVFHSVGNLDINGYMVALIAKCWAQKPEERPNIGAVVQELEGIYKQLQGAPGI